MTLVATKRTIDPLPLSFLLFSEVPIFCFSMYNPSIIFSGRFVRSLVLVLLLLLHLLTFFYLSMKYIEIDVFGCSRCLNDFINVVNLIGPFPSLTYTPWWWKLRLNNHSRDIFNFNYDSALSGGKIWFYSFYLLLYLGVQGFHT